MLGRDRLGRGLVPGGAKLRGRVARTADIVRSDPLIRSRAPIPCSPPQRATESESDDEPAPHDHPLAPDRPQRAGPGPRSRLAAWPPRLPEQPIFYPVLNEDYAIRIARDWNVKHDGAGFVTRFDVDAEFLSRYPVQQAGGRTILELWVPAEELDEFNAHIVGEIRVVHEFR